MFHSFSTAIYKPCVFQTLEWPNHSYYANNEALWDCSNLTVLCPPNVFFALTAFFCTNSIEFRVNTSQCFWHNIRLLFFFFYLQAISVENSLTFGTLPVSSKSHLTHRPSQEGRGNCQGKNCIWQHMWTRICVKAFYNSFIAKLLTNYVTSI